MGQTKKITVIYHVGGWEEITVTLQNVFQLLFGGCNLVRQEEAPNINKMDYKGAVIIARNDVAISGNRNLLVLHDSLIFLPRSISFHKGFLEETSLDYLSPHLHCTTIGEELQTQ